MESPCHCMAQMSLCKQCPCQPNIGYFCTEFLVKEHIWALQNINATLESLHRHSTMTAVACTQKAWLGDVHSACYLAQTHRSEHCNQTERGPCFIGMHMHSHDKAMPYGPYVEFCTQAGRHMSNADEWLTGQSDDTEGNNQALTSTSSALLAGS